VVQPDADGSWIVLGAFDATLDLGTTTLTSTNGDDGFYARIPARW
jgi:hypothetical protein